MEKRQIPVLAQSFNDRQRDTRQDDLQFDNPRRSPTYLEEAGGAAVLMALVAETTPLPSTRAAAPGRRLARARSIIAGSCMRV